MSNKKVSHFFKVCTLDVNPMDLEIIRPSACPIKNVKVNTIGFHTQFVITLCKLLLLTPNNTHEIVLPNIIDLNIVDSFFMRKVYKNLNRKEFYFALYPSMNQYMYKIKTDSNLPIEYQDIEITEEHSLV